MKTVHKNVIVQRDREEPLEREMPEKRVSNKHRSKSPVHSERKKSKSRKRSRKRRSRKDKTPHDESENYGNISDRFYPDTQSAAYHELEFQRAMQDAEEWREYDRKLAKRKSTREQCAIAEDCTLL